MESDRKTNQRVYRLAATAALVLGLRLLGAGATAADGLPPAPTPNSPDEPLAASFSPERAVEFLDAASLAWTTNRKCLTCHTNINYMLARPALGAPTPAQDEIRKFFEGRVARWDGGAKPSWDAEVVALATALAANDAATTGKLHPRTRQALDRMWTVQKPEGNWTWLNCKLPPYEHDDYYGATFAALGVGLAPENYRDTPAARAGLDRLRTYFKANPPPSLHHKMMLLWASLKVDGLMESAEREATVKELLALQRPDGGWNLASLGDWKRRDGSANRKDAPGDGFGTGFVVYVLRQAGLPADHPQIRQGVDWLRTHQRESGRWFTRSVSNDKAHYITHAGSGFAVLALSATGAFQAEKPRAQRPERKPTPNDTLKSVEVAPDRKVTFRIYAPKADEVTLSGDFGKGGPLSKDEKGVWSLTVGPLAPDFYSYTFSVDGVRTVDPKSGLVKPGVNSLDSMFQVPGEAADFEATRDVPHGEVRSLWYRSGTLGTMRRMHVYTPPGYEGGSEKYPVFYLLHGGGDDDAGWSTIGRAGFILDNLLAAHKAVPMVVVMPNGSLPTPKDMPPRPARGETPSPEFIAAMEAQQSKFADELLNDVMPVVEKTYRVKTGAPNRALAGLSMGGGQTLRMLTTHPDRFAYVAVWSAGLFGGKADAWEKRNETFLSAPDKVNETVKRLDVVIGDEDFLLDGSKALVGVLEKRGIKHHSQITGGGHTWINWRHYLNEWAPTLFR